MGEVSIELNITMSSISKMKKKKPRLREVSHLFNVTSFKIGAAGKLTQEI